jgi:hypothetical protein
MSRRISRPGSKVALRTVIALVALFLARSAGAAPKVVLISLDGATPRIAEAFLETGVLPRDQGLGLLRRAGVVAERNVVITPSLTAPSHIAIATGSSAARNDISANTFHLLASPFTTTVSGFSAPIGGYSLDGPAESTTLTANPIWHALRASGKSVVAATFPGADGLDVKVPGLANSPIVQPAHLRTVDFTVPFGEFGGAAAKGFTLGAADFGPAPAATVTQLSAAGRKSFSPILQTVQPLDTFTVTGGKSYTIQAAALDTTDDGRVDYDTLVFFDAALGIAPGPFALPSTGPAYVKASDRRSSPFFLEGSARRAGTAFFVSAIAADLSIVRVARYAANDIPPNPAVQSNVDDINTHVGFWAAQADFRIPEKLSPGFASFPDADLEAIYEDQVVTFVDYQTRVALRAIEQNPNADLVMVYIEQPDGSEHQFLLVDPRQPTNPLDATSIGSKQDPAKVARYAGYVQVAYQTANRAVQRLIEAVGVDHTGRPRSDVIVVSDHGFDPFHTAVSMGTLLQGAGIDPSQVRAVTSGPAVNLYINLAGRGPGGSVTPEQYIALQKQLVDLLRGLQDNNALYTRGARSVPVFDKVFARPNLPVGDPSFGRTTSHVIGQDSGDIFAMLATGYNFDGAQSPVVQRSGDPISTSPVLSLPNFYGAHGYDPSLAHMSAILYAAGPDIRRHKRLESVRNVDVAPTIARILGVKPDPTVEGRVLEDLLKRPGEARREDEE